MAYFICPHWLRNIEFSSPHQDYNILNNLTHIFNDCKMWPINLRKDYSLQVHNSNICRKICRSMGNEMNTSEFYMVRISEISIGI
jgi:hypothetical protein